MIKENDRPNKKITVALLASVVALLLVTWANAMAVGPEPLPPFKGIIKNNTKHDISIPSENSLATLILPAKGWIEYVVWDPKFDLAKMTDDMFEVLGKKHEAGEL